MWHPYSIDIRRFVVDRKANMSFGVNLGALLAVLGVTFQLYLKIRLASECS